MGELFVLMSKKFWNWFDKHAYPKLAGRADTFRAMFEYLDTLKRPVDIVETGCVRRNITDDCWAGDGCSTLMFDRYIEYNDGSVHSVDIDRKATAFWCALRGA